VTDTLKDGITIASTYRTSANNGITALAEVSNNYIPVE